VRVIIRVVTHDEMIQPGGHRLAWASIDVTSSASPDRHPSDSRPHSTSFTPLTATPPLDRLSGYDCDARGPHENPLYVLIDGVLQPECKIVATPTSASALAPLQDHVRRMVKYRQVRPQDDTRAPHHNLPLWMTM
jgi:hypothetical protein